MKSSMVIGTRGSTLAVTQTEQLIRALRAAHPRVTLSLEKIRTTGDEDTERAFSALGAKGVFTRQLDEALVAGKIDAAVHSMKDLPSELPREIVLAAVSLCHDPRDVLISKGGASLSALPPGARVGTASLRRTALLRALRPDLDIQLLRGNLDTRIRRVDEGAFEAIVVAAAGVERLGLKARISEYLDPKRFVPAIGQGKLAVTAREGDEATLGILRAIDDPKNHRLARIERVFMARMEGGCLVPLGCHAELEGSNLRLHGYLALPDGTREIRMSEEGELSHGESIAEKLAERMLATGGREILRQIRPALSRRKILLTRPRQGAEPWIAKLKEAGAEVIQVPVIAIEPSPEPHLLAEAVARREAYDLVVFTSANAVRAFFSLVKGDWKAPPIAAVGPATEEALVAHGVHATWVPAHAGGAEELVERLRTSIPLGETKVLFPRAEEGREVLPEALRAEGAEVDVVVAYRTVTNVGSHSAIYGLLRGRADWVIFASGSAVRAFVSLAEPTDAANWMREQGVRTAAIGRTTAQALRDHGMEVSAQASEPTPQALVQAMLRFESEAENG